MNVSSTDGNPYGLKNIDIRGLKTIRGTNLPLIIVDGVEMNNAVNLNTNAFELYGEQGYATGFAQMLGISAYDIESIEVLKNISQTAQYGSRGANGVIIIRNKIGAENSSTIKLHSNVTSNLAHNHHLAFKGLQGQSAYNISAFYRDAKGSADKSEGDFIGFKANFDTKAGSTLEFGINILMAMGDYSNPATTRWYGSNPFVNDGWEDGYDDDTKEYSSTASTNFKLNFTPWLSLKIEGGADFRNVGRYFWYGSETAFGQSYKGVASHLSTSMIAYNAATKLSFQRYFAQKHRVDANLGLAIRGNAYEFNNMSGDDFFIESLRANGLGMMNSAKIVRKYRHYYFNKGFFGDIAYSYEDIAGFNANLKAEKNERYSESLDIYPSANLWLNLFGFRLTAGYGKAGMFQSMPYPLGASYCHTLPAIDKEGWEYYEGGAGLVSEEYNVGLEYSLLSNRIKLSAGYYDNKTKDDFCLYAFGVKGKNYWYGTDRSEYYSAPQAILYNRGLEFDVDALVINGQAFKWSVDANFTVNSNQVGNNEQDNLFGQTVGSSLVANVNAIGYSVGAIYGYKSDANGNPFDYNNDGIISGSDRLILGETVPKYFGAVGTNFKWKNLGFDAIINGVYGNKILNMNAMVKDGANLVTDKYVESGDFLRLKRVSVTYDLILNHRWVKSTGISLSALNLLTLTKYSGENPDVSSFGKAISSRGIDFGACPPFKAIILGININF